MCKPVCYESEIDLEVAGVVLGETVCITLTAIF